jgi:hypothetical protein
MTRFQKAGINQRVTRFRAVETPMSHHIGCALSHREIVAAASRQGWRNVLVFEDDVMFAPDVLETLGRSMAELRSKEWDLLYLGGCAWGRSFEKAAGCRHLDVPVGLTCTHAIAYHRTVYARILRDVPPTPSEAALWLRKARGIDQYLCGIDVRKLVTSPVVASQESILASEKRGFE